MARERKTLQRTGNTRLLPSAMGQTESGGSSDDEDLLGVLRGPSSFANAFLYVGLGTIAIGLVIAFVGTGEKGFKTVELRLIGPSLIGLGLICCILRILFCICPSHCISSSRRARDKKNAKIDADHRTSLLRGDSKRVSIARGPHIPTKQPQIYPKSIVKTKTYEGVEALRQIATTSLFLQNEQKVSSNRIVPIIKEPEKLEEPPLELKKIDSRRDEAAIVSISDGEDDSHRHRPAAGQQQSSSGAARSDMQVIDLAGEDQDDEHSPGSGSSHQRKDSKLRRQRTSVHQQKPARELQTSAYGSGGAVPSEHCSNLQMETSLMVIGPTPLSSPTKTMQQAGGSSSLTVPMPANGGSALLGPAHSSSNSGSSSSHSKPVTSQPGTSASGGNLLTLPPQSSSMSGGVIGPVSVSFVGSTVPLPGQLSPLPSTSYPVYRASAGSIPDASSPHYNSNSSSSSSNYIFSPPPFTQQDPNTLGTNTNSTVAPVHTTKTEPELVLSPAKLGQ
ncbi:AGAP008919-PA-like protein [Anopheles sinensis]|uniref:AGAP008919-PA-like protein n=1 Tax=Anopheles sinensis TaxID=74873 RepID=A0A084W7E6_ANOSI|nr:AGAP008919-PA-like protein [Anopheles sinensis]